MISLESNMQGLSAHQIGGSSGHRQPQYKLQNQQSFSSSYQMANKKQFKNQKRDILRSDDMNLMKDLMYKMSKNRIEDKT